MSEALLKLAERCEAAEGPDRELDALIWCALHGVKFIAWFDCYGRNSGRLTQVEFCEPPKRTRIVTKDRGPHKHALPVTASLDAAMALVPEGWEWFAGNCGGQATGSVNPSAQPFPAHLDIEVDAATPALALTAAALRARAAQGGSK